MVKILSLSFRVRNFLPEENGESPFAQAALLGEPPSASPGARQPPRQAPRRSGASAAAAPLLAARQVPLLPRPRPAAPPSPPRQPPRKGEERSRPCRWTARGLPRLLALPTALSAGNRSSSSSTSPLGCSMGRRARVPGRARGENEMLDIELLAMPGLKNLRKWVLLKTRVWVLRAWPARQLRRALEKIRSLPSLESSPSWLTNPLCFQALLSMNVLS